MGSHLGHEGQRQRTKDRIVNETNFTNMRIISGLDSVMPRWRCGLVTDCCYKALRGSRLCLFSPKETSD